MKRNPTIIAAIVFFVVVGATLSALIPHDEKNPKQAYQDFITSHPYLNRDISPDELNALGKFDRPDLAAEHNFLQVMDPRLRRIPTERLAPAYDYTRSMLKSKNLADFSISQDLSAPALSQDTETAASQAAAIPDVNWVERGPNNVGGRTRALMWDPNDLNGTKVWAGSVSGGIWFNDDITDENSSWFAVDDFLSSLAISSFAYNPNETLTFYAGTGEGFIAGNNGGGVAGAGLYKSEDGGSTWFLLPSTLGPEFRYIQKVVVTASGAVIVATRPSINEGGTSGVFRSTDGGEKWVRVLDGRGTDLQVAANNDVYASTGLGTGEGQVWRSINDGISWTEVTPPGGNPLWIELAVAPSQSDSTHRTRIYAVAQDANTRTSVTWFQRSDDGGENWINLEIPNYINQSCVQSTEDFTRGQAFYDLILAVQPANADVVTIGGIDIYRSINAGADMQLVSYWTGNCDDFVHADQHEAVFRPGFPNEAVFGHDGGVSYSSDIGDPTVEDPNFDTRNNNYSVTQFYAVAGRNEIGSGNFLAGAQDNGTQRFTVEGGATTAMAVGGDGTFCHIDQSDGNFQIASVQFNAIQHSSDGGFSFRSLTPQNTSHAFINPTDLDNQSHILYAAAASNEYLFIRGINTEDPEDEEFINVNVGNISHINANSTTDHRLYVGSRQGEVFRIDNANTETPEVTLITSNITTDGNVSSIDIGSTDDQLIVTYSNFGVTSVWITTDGGESWTSKDEEGFGLPDIPIRWALFNPSNSNQVLLATELGVWSSNNVLSDNPQWEPTSSNLANVRCDMLQYREADEVVIVATFGRGVFTTDVFSNLVDIEPPVIVSLKPNDGAQEVLLDQNLVFTFTEPVQAATGTISIFQSADDVLVETIDINSSRINITGPNVSIDPTADLQPSTGFYVAVSAGAITDISGNSFEGISDPAFWNFVTFDGDFPPTVSQPIGSIRIQRDESTIVEEVVDLSEVFTDIDNNDEEITFQIVNNGDPSLLGTSISAATLTLSALVPGAIGEVALTLEGTSNGKTATNDFTVFIGDELLYEQTNNLSPTSIISMQITDRDDAIIQLADEFVIGAGDAYELTGVTVFGSLSNPAEGQSNTAVTSFMVEVYRDLDDSPNDEELVFSQQVQATFTANQNQVRLPLSPRSLGDGTYWLSVFAVSPIETARWNWVTRTSTGNDWSLNNRDGFFASIEADSWLSAGDLDFEGLDLAFSLEGITREGTQAPTGLSSQIEGIRVALDWSDNSSNESAFIIERSLEPNQNFEAIGAVNAGVTSFFDNGILEDETEYFYRVVAAGPFVDSSPSNTTSILYEKPLNLQSPNEVELILFPNPAAENLTVRIFDDFSFSSLVITDLSGKRLYSFSTEPSQLATVALTGIEPGIYVLRLADGSRTVSTRFVKR